MAKPPDTPSIPPDDSQPGDLETIDAKSSARMSASGAGPAGSWPGPGAEFGAYKIVRFLGQGGFGSVWEAEETTTGRRVALKLLSELGLSSPEVVERFRQEARLAASLSHPSIVFVFGVEESQGTLGIAMELMPAGTLQDRLRERGRFPVCTAVDQVLRLLDGLEAARLAGIIHRDIKPSNCFLDDAGDAKLGDFGISKNLGGDPDLTRARSYIGTPAYSSPEQIRGRELDFRSDLYSLGATLYTLLNGFPPFEEGNPIEVVARILSEDPRPFTKDGEPIPKRLQETVRKLLAKDPGKRHQSCEDLRSALLPYSSAGIATAPLGLRVLGNIVDHGLVGIITVPASIHLLGQRGVDIMFSSTDLGTRLTFEIGQNFVAFLYFALQEIFWGRSLGKHLFGLSIHSVRPQRSPRHSILLRNLVFHGIFTVLQVGPILAGFDPRQLPGLVPWTMLVPIVLICVTMRRTNAFAGLHEVLSGTRSGLTPRARRSLGSAGASLRTIAEADRAFGPYRATGTVWESDGEALLLGRDDVLGRSVWIHVLATGSPAPSIAELAESGADRLTWLQGSRAAGDCWDAYEAPGGESLVHFVRRRGRLGWGEMRMLLAGLLDALGDATGPNGNRFSLHHIWVDAQDRVRLLVFPTSSPASVPAALTIGARDWVSVSRKVVSFGLQGEAGMSSREVRPAIPLPGYAVPLMDTIFGEPGRAGDRDAVRAELERIRDKPDRIRPSRRLGILALEWSLAVPVLLMLLLVGYMVRDFPEVNRLSRIGRLQEVYPDSLATPEREARLAGLEKVFAYNYTHAKATAMGRNLLAQVTPDAIRLLDETVERHPGIEKSEYLEARDLVKKDLGGTLGDFYTNPGRTGLLVVAYVQLPVMLLALVFSVIVRGGLLLRFLGISVQTRSGEEAGGGRCLLRAFAAWLPLIAVWGAVLVVEGAGLKSIPRMIESHGVVVSLLVCIYLAMRLYSLVRPERGLEDLAAGTVLTPR